MESNIKLSSVYKFDCYRGDKLVWTETKENLVVDTGLELAIDLPRGHSIKSFI